MSPRVPAPKFELYERVVIKSKERGFHGERGTVVCIESSAIRKDPAQPDRWAYVVHLPTHVVWRTFLQSDLESEGVFDPESVHRGERPEVSFDLVMKDDNDWMEGTYRLRGELWKVVIFRKDDVPELQLQPTTWKKPTKWEREVPGIVIRFPRKARVGRDDLLAAMSQAFGCSDWTEVDGPDSMMLR
ncbi:MAG: hypothetical protein QGG36_23370 [Pirellulaceae bacterium]|nr:hypothetical protein [Pirellulaceae bacterium]MDP7018760.1 hypothetical protein [Pirellulaceae bacterium]